MDVVSSTVAPPSPAPPDVVATGGGTAWAARAALGAVALLVAAGLGAAAADLLRLGLSAGADGTVVLDVLVGVWAAALAAGTFVTGALVLAGRVWGAERAGEVPVAGAAGVARGGA